MIRYGGFFLITLLLLFPGPGFAETKESCSKINLLNNRWPALPDQQPPKMCYATVVADTLSFESGIRVSAVAVANETEKNEDGVAEKIRALRYGQRYAYHRFSAFGKSLPAAYRAALGTPLCGRNFLDEIKTDEMLKLFSTLEDAREKNIAELRMLIPKTFPHATPGFAEKLFGRSKENLPLIDMAVEIACEPIALPKILHSKNQDFTNSSLAENLNLVQQVLKAGHGVAVGYDFSVLDNSAVADREKAQHASTLVGQGWNEVKSRCEYVLRLTDLATCTLVKAPALCKDGLVTVPRGEFLKAVSDVAWVE